MTLYARQRSDLQHENIPASDSQYYWLYDTWYEARQPDELDDEQFNVIIPAWDNLRFASIDLEFKSE